MRSGFILVCAAALALLAGGCITLPSEQIAEETRAREDFLLLQEDIRQLSGRIEGIELEMDRLRARMDASRTEQAGALSAQLEGLRAKTSELDARIRALDAARDKDRQEIVDSLSRKVSQIVSTPPAATGRTKSQRPVKNEGYEHVVQPGETLSAIAAAYKVKAADIIEANGLKSADQLRAGQKLFIPAP
jgi:chromosome segregation ATPase